MKIWPVLSSLFVGSLFLMMLLLMQPNGVVASASTAAGKAPDLVIESLTMQPSLPNMNEPVAITIRVRNQGNANASGGFRTYLYIDADDQPPLTDTQHTQQWGYFVTLPPDGVVEFELEGYTFEECVDKHLLYAWVDGQNQMEESDETNNLAQLNFNCQPTAVTLDSLNAQKAPRLAWLAMGISALAFCLGYKRGSNPNRLPPQP